MISLEKIQLSRNALVTVRTVFKDGVFALPHKKRGCSKSVLEGVKEV
jgi:hypothetical protein